MTAQVGLSLDNINAWYGHAHVVQGVSMEIGAECLALMGRNGTGKTSLARAIMGLAPPRATGSVRIGGNDVSTSPPHQRSNAGLGYVPQGRRVFGSVSVDEHLMLVRKVGGIWTKDDVYDLFPTLSQRYSALAGNLSGGQKSMLAFARALMTNPKCLVLDEPTEGLAPAIVDEMSHAIRNLVDAGVPVLLIEQNIHATEISSDRVAILSAGRLAGSWSTEEFRSDHTIRDQYLGLSAIEAT